MKKLISFIALVIVLLIVVVMIRTVRFTSKQIRTDQANNIAIDADKVAGHLARALQFQTVSYQDPTQVKTGEFLGLHKYLEETFPKVHSSLKKEVISDYSLLYTWKGQEDGLKPILLMGHMDVVPVEPGSESRWTHSPFEGKIIDGYVWGRG